MSRKILLLLVLVGSMVILTAQGHRKNDNDGRDGRDEGRHEERIEKILEEGDIITLKGSLILENGEMPILESKGIKYHIMAPVNQLMELKLTNGMKITVSGVQMPYPPMQWDGKESSIFVTEIEIKGKSFEIDHNDRDGFCGFGPRGGERNGKGHFGRTPE